MILYPLKKLCPLRDIRPQRPPRYQGGARARRVGHPSGAFSWNNLAMDAHQDSGLLQSSQTSPSVCLPPAPGPRLSSLNAAVSGTLPATCLGNTLPSTLPGIVWQASELSAECLAARVNALHVASFNQPSLPKPESPF